MTLRCAFLARDHFPQVYQTFREAFADYQVDSSYVTERVLLNRAIKNGVDFDLSIGTFDDRRMVGFTIVGIDDWDNMRSAFDIVTGIIPACRGKGIATRMFDFAIPKLRARGVRRFLLEVLQTNEPAVKAYRRAGFSIRREFDCFELRLDNANLTGDLKVPLHIQAVGKEELGDFEEHLDWQPSWENSLASINRIPDEIVMYGGFLDDRCVGLIVYYPLLNWIMNLVVKIDYRRRGIATRLLAHLLDHLGADISVVKLINVDHSDRAMLRLLGKAGFELLVRQFEMECNLENPRF
jgi:ribosomal protein S18 acetylase RimI-like enzyme